MLLPILTLFSPASRQSTSLKFLSAHLSIAKSFGFYPSKVLFMIIVIWSFTDE